MQYLPMDMQNWWVGMKNQSAMDFFIPFVPGAFSGFVQILLGHPLDTIKTRLQAATINLQQQEPQHSSSSGSGPPLRGSGSITKSSVHVESAKTFGLLRQMIREEGIFAPYRGVMPPLLMYSMKRAMQLAMWESMQKLPIFAPEKPTSTSTSSGTHAGIGKMTSTGERRGRHYSFIGNAKSFICGGIAGFFGCVIGCPGIVVKIQTQNTLRGDTRNALTCALDIVKNDGILGFYRGFHYHALKDVCFASMYLGTYGLLREKFGVLGTNSSSTSGEGKDISVMKNEGAEGGEDATTTPPFSSSKSATTTVVGLAKSISESPAFRSFSIGAFASIITWATLFPLDTIKTYVQARKKSTDLLAAIRSEVQDVANYNSARNLQRMSKCWFRHGKLAKTEVVVRLLWRGLPAALLRAGPVSGATMLSYDYSREYLKGFTAEREKKSARKEK